MQGFQHSVLHANGKCGFCHVQWPMDNEGQEDYECGRGMLLKPLSFVERLCILIAGNHFACTLVILKCFLKVKSSLQSMVVNDM